MNEEEQENHYFVKSVKKEIYYFHERDGNTLWENLQGIFLRKYKEGDKK